MAINFRWGIVLVEEGRNRCHRRAQSSEHYRCTPCLFHRVRWLLLFALEFVDGITQLSDFMP
jgi:hypothetical protein